MKKANPIPQKKTKTTARGRRLAKQIPILLENDPSSYLSKGDKVQLNVQKIQSRTDYARYTSGYKEFVASSVERIFTVQKVLNTDSEKLTLVGFEEEPTWLFNICDLIRIEPEAVSK
jgi:hypothetical protein